MSEDSVYQAGFQVGGTRRLAIGALLIGLAATAPMAIDMFLPSLPSMTAEFRSNEATMQFGVTLFLLTFAASQLIYGPASDRLGRRPVMFAGLAIFIIGSFVCLTADSAGQLIAGRVLQGFGGGVGPTLANATVLDLYGREHAARFIGYMSIAIPLAPAIAPIIGGFLEHAFGWQSVFVTLAGIGLLLLVSYATLLPETRPTGLPARRGLIHDYRTLFASPTFVGYAAVMGTMFAGQLLFISTSSFVLQDRLGMGPQAFGFSFGFVALGIMGGATISTRLVRRLPARRVVLFGVLTSSGASGVMMLLALSGLAHPMSVLLPMFVTAIGLGMARPGAMAGALVPFPHIAGLASAVLGFSQMALSTGYNIVYSQFVAPGVLALSVGVFAAVTSALLVVLVLRPGRREEEQAAAVAAAH